MKRIFLPPGKATVHGLFLSLGLWLVFSLVLTGCQSRSSMLPSIPTARPTFTPLVVKTSPPLAIRTAVPLLPASTRSAGQSVATPAAASARPSQPDRPLHLYLVQHSNCTWDEFWCPVEQGIADAARELDVEVTILSPDKYDLAKISAQIDEAVAAKPDGIAVTISDPVFLHEAVLRAVQSGIPVLAYNAGSGPIQDKLAYLGYIGIDNYQAGYLAALRLIDAGARKGVCINHAPALSALQIRCRGFQDAFYERSLTADVLDTTTSVGQSEQLIQAYAQTHPDVNAYLTNGPLSASAFYAYRKAAGRKPGEVLHGTFDLGPEIESSIKEGVTLFAIDQQPYLQGYQSVFWLTMIACFGFKPAQPVLSTGPVFVDKTALAAAPDPARPIHFYLVHHALCTWDPYWCVIDRGAQDAARNMNVEVTILGPETFDLEEMASLIDQAVDARPSGLIASIPDARVLREPILRAAGAGIPVIAIDSGFGPTKDDLPYLTFVGQDEYQAGYLSALRLIDAGAKEGVCINHQKGGAALEERCRGFTDAFRNRGLMMDYLDCTGDPIRALSLVKAYAVSHPGTNAYLTLSAQDPGAVSFYDFMRATGRKPGDLLHGTFDLSPAVVDAIENDTTLFAVDAQPYLQGYISVMMMTQLLRRHIRPVSSITPTGPAFVDKGDIGLIKLLAGEYR